MRQCSPVADRHIRAGVHEMSELARVDRTYCDDRMFRDLVLENGDVEPATCRKNLTDSIYACENELCPQCTSECTYPAAGAIATVLKCTVANSRLAFLYCAHVTDAGQLVMASHGAVRGDGKLAVPERLQKHLYRACHNNKEGIVQRDSVSCRKTHRNSPMGHFTPGFDSNGNPIARSGFMVPCKRHSDCASTCPVHPLTGKVRQCRHVSSSFL
jgi:hypothetical protein